jgi:hypothetical protein
MINVEKLKKALNTASDDMPMHVYRQLIIDIAEALVNDDRVEFAMCCGVVSHELVEAVSGETL